MKPRQAQGKWSQLTKYLSGYPGDHENPLEAWKDLQSELVLVADMARDVLAVPISSVGVERTFNMARDICSYRRGHLNAESIRQLMMVKHHDQQHLEDEYAIEALVSGIESREEAGLVLGDEAIDIEDPDLACPRGRSSSLSSLRSNSPDAVIEEELAM